MLITFVSNSLMQISSGGFFVSNFKKVFVKQNPQPSKRCADIGTNTTALYQYTLLLHGISVLNHYTHILINSYIIIMIYNDNDNDI